jgi:hypothetical protein
MLYEELDAEECYYWSYHQQDDTSLEVLGIAILIDPSSLSAHLVPKDLPEFSVTY